MTDRPTFDLRLRPEKGVDDPVYSLRLALKRLLRDYGLRCLSVQVVASTCSTGSATAVRLLALSPLPLEFDRCSMEASRRAGVALWRELHVMTGDNR